MPTALIKITQGLTTDVPGRAVKGSLTGGSVAFENGDATDVVAWTYQLLETPPGSAISPTTQGPGPTVDFTMVAPDVPGSYRMMLTVVDAAGVEDVDIRNFAVGFPNLGIIAPPYQGNPPPLPLTGAGAKPDEMNFGGQGDGWGGDTNSARILMYQTLREVDLNGWGSFPIFQTTNNTANQVAGEIGGATLVDGDYVVIAEFIAKEATDHAAYYITALFTVAAGVVTIQGTAQSWSPAIESAGATNWNATLDDNVGNSRIQFLVTGDTGDNIDWTIYYRMRKTK